MTFAYDARLPRIIFGRGTAARIREEVDRLERKRAMVLTTPGGSRFLPDVLGVLGPTAVTTFTDAAMHTPVGTTRAALSTVRAHEADCLVAVGGGSAIGLGKALAFRTHLDQIALPTTYAGSEVTSILGQTEDGEKEVLRHQDVQPETVIYDPELSSSLPIKISMASGLNALAHATEALYAPDRNPITTAISASGIHAMVKALRGLSSEDGDMRVRDEALLGACLCGVALETVRMGLHHRLCHELGGAYALPHAELHAVLLPQVVAAVSDAVPGGLAPLEDALGATTPGLALFDLLVQAGLPTSLDHLGMPNEGVEITADRVLRDPPWSPFELTREGLQELLQRALKGAPPTR